MSFAFKGSPCYQPCTESLSLHFGISNSLETERAEQRPLTFNTERTHNFNSEKP